MKCLLEHLTLPRNVGSHCDYKIEILRRCLMEKNQSFANLNITVTIHSSRCLSSG